MTTPAVRRLTPAEAADNYARWLATGTAFSDRTKNAYETRARAFLAWLAEKGAPYEDALDDPHSRDYAVRDYRRELLTVRKWSTASVELAMSAIGSLYGFLGMGKPNVKRTNPKQGGPKALTEDGLRGVLRACERRGTRDFAIGSLLFLCAVRVSELSALDVDDVFISERLGQMQVRYGKGGKSRTVPVPKNARAALRPWLAERREKFGHATTPALFLNRSGERLSTRSIQRIIESAGDAAGVKVTPHVLRHTYGRRWVEGGGDIVALQQILGHENVQTTAGYARPSHDYLNDQAETMGIDL